ncbi:MAG: hypothetical protein ACRD43_02010, partial [Pyrinomonadaceae bacterium]
MKPENFYAKCVTSVRQGCGTQIAVKIAGNTNRQAGNIHLIHTEQGGNAFMNRNIKVIKKNAPVKR